MPGLTRNKMVSLIMLVAIAALLLYGARSSSQPTQVDLPDQSLKTLAEWRNIAIGNFAISSRINEPAYREILTTQFNLALLDNTPNWYFTDGGLRPSRETYDFKQMDELVRFSQRHGMAMEAHHFVWGEEKWLPDWLKEGNFSKETLEQLIREHIQVVGGRYAGQIEQWTVVNEAFSRGQNKYGLRDWWADNTGSKDYIDLAFKEARKADPGAVLILNDFNNETRNSISDEMYTYIQSATARGVPIDGLGMQMHIDGTKPPAKADVIATMQRFADLGVDVYVTEFDVNMHYVQGSPQAKNDIQAEIYFSMLRACIESTVCKSFSVLGITDKETWYNYVGLTRSRPLPFDALYRPKPAFYAMYHALNQQ